MRNSFSAYRGCEIEEPVHVLDFRQSYCELIATEKSSCGGDRTAVPSDGKFTKRTLYHRASRPRRHLNLLLIVFFQNEFFSLQISETSADERGVSERLGRGAGRDVAVDRLVWNAVCVVGRRLAGRNNNNNNMEQVKLNSITFSYVAISEVVYVNSMPQ